MKYLKTLLLFFAIASLSISCKNADEIKKRAEASKPKAVAEIIKAIEPTNLGKIKKIGVVDYENKLKDVTLVDVRSAQEFAKGHLKGAINIDFKKRTFPDYINVVAKDKPVAVYCGSDNRSGKAAIIMQSLGFKEIYDLDGGYKAWNAENKEITKGDNEANKKLQEILKKGELKGKVLFGKSHQIEVDEFEKLAKSGKVTLVDVRTPKEFAQGHIKGAINVDWKNRHFAKNATSSITNDKPIAIYCGSGNRGTRAMFAMSALGFTEVYNLKDGIKSWNAANKALKTLEVKGDVRKLDAPNFSNAILGKVGVLIDVRTPKEHSDYHIPGAKNIDYKNKNFKTEFEKLDKKVPVLIYCRSGGRSGRAMKTLEKMGFTVYNLEKGMVEWTKIGFAVQGNNLHAGGGSGEEGC